MREKIFNPQYKLGEIVVFQNGTEFPIDEHNRINLIDKAIYDTTLRDMVTVGICHVEREAPEPEPEIIGTYGGYQYCVHPDPFDHSYQRQGNDSEWVYISGDCPLSEMLTEILSLRAELAELKAKKPEWVAFESRGDSYLTNGVLIAEEPEPLADWSHIIVRDAKAAWENRNK